MSPTKDQIRELIISSRRQTPLDEIEYHVNRIYAMQFGDIADVAEWMQNGEKLYSWRVTGYSMSDARYANTITAPNDRSALRIAAADGLDIYARYDCVYL